VYHAGVRTLFILRHAKSGHDEPVSDKERTLTPRGRKDARRMGELARERAQLAERVLCSTATRARETLDLFAEGAEFEASPLYLDELYLAEPDAIVRAIREHAGSTDRVMIVGHNPGLEALVAHLTADRVELATAAFVECTLPIGAWSDLNLETAGRLASSSSPKDER
jgi:phosphohistidine phosphatase